MKKRYFNFGACVSIGLFAVPVSGWAQMVMTEIMYDVPGTDSGREWVEVRNGGQDAVDLSAWKLFEANVSHKITAMGVSQVAPGGYAIIADSPEKFMSDNPNFSGPLFDSAFSLSSDGEALVLRDAVGADADSVSYDPMIGAKGDGMSLQRVADGRWVSAMPTPGSATTAVQSETVALVDDAGSDSESGSGEGGVSSVSQDSQSGSAHSSQVLANTSADEVELEVTSGRARLGLIDTAIEFRARVRKGASATSSIDHAWSMGDGSVRHGAVIDHTYRFAGFYSVVLNSSSRASVAVSRVAVRIMEPQISIIGLTDQYVEVENHGSSEINIGGWSFQTEAGRFIVGADTIIASKGSLKIAFSSVPGFPAPRDFVRFMSPLGRVFGERLVMGPGRTSDGDVLIELPAGMTRESLEVIIRTAIESHD